MTSILSNDTAPIRMDAELPSSSADAIMKLSPSLSTKPPPRKRQHLLPHRKLHMSSHMLKHQGSSSLEPKHRNYKNYDHLQKVKFVLFLKILLHYLTMKDQEVGEQARALILDCIKSQREGKLQDTPLVSVLKGRLFGLVGKKDWEVCEKYLEQYLVYNNILTEL